MKNLWKVLMLLPIVFMFCRKNKDKQENASNLYNYPVLPQ